MFGKATNILLLILITRRVIENVPQIHMVSHVWVPWTNLTPVSLGSGLQRFGGFNCQLPNQWGWGHSGWGATQSILEIPQFSIS